MTKDSKPGGRLSRVRPGSTLRLEIHLSTFACYESRLSCAEVGELLHMLMAEAAGEEVGHASTAEAQHIYDLRDDYRKIRGGFGRAAVPLAVRQEVYERDGHRCTYCGIKVEWVDYHCDHVEPASKGGSNDPSNLTTSCIPCNLSKAGKLLAEWVR